MSQRHATKVPSSRDATDPCSHPLCRDLAMYYEQQPRLAVGDKRRPKPLPMCRAHHLEYKYLQHVERQRARPKPPSKRVLHPCGTSAAAARHRRRKEPVCDPCRLAENARTRAQKERAREARR